ncbi:Ferric reductase like transmembrane component [Pseudonocardia thermophila]|jgi:Predicted ferric reductase|uniref:Ferric reductase like transmembrane component n=1 Tax=Pseudonocardia thermophila TaxID=1848 RepID=A0A1M6YCA6_PSETH|nr:ferric reductase-like transmembrane domain-containing protein [Pseudonocardia thermophila]SHL15770.1 Ferric reductase like transmembrane component [Pseudonocardia thermophila]
MDQALWFASRGTGLVSLLLLTATVVLGAEHAGRTAGARWPRFTVHAVHRNLSLLSLAFLAVHVGTAVADSYAGIRVVDAFLPFVSAYKPLYLGLGAVALDLMLALLITSALRTRVPLAAWQWLHRAAYAMWPLAVVHGIGAGGKDSNLLWVQALNVICVAAVLVVVWRRLADRRRTPAPMAVTARLPRQRTGAHSREKAFVR